MRVHIVIEWTGTMTDLGQSDDQLITAGSTTALATVSSTNPGWRRRKRRTHTCRSDIDHAPRITCLYCFLKLLNRWIRYTGLAAHDFWLSRGVTREAIP